MPKVSIIITSYNYEKYIEKSILSCIEQKNFDDFEVIVIDDGSTDNTKKILEKYSNRIRYFIITNQGIEKASNIGIKKAKGDYIVRVDADDMLKNDYLNTVIPFIQNSDYAFVYPEYYIIDSYDNIIGEKDLPKFDSCEIKKRGDFLATGTLYKKCALLDIGLYNEKNKNCGLENYELILNLLTKGYNGFCVKNKLFYYRQHNSNISLTRRESIINYGEKLAQNFDLPYYHTNENHPWGLSI